MALINCSECGNQISDKAAICPKCGAPVEQRIVCSECKSRVPAKSFICPECGNPLPLAVECPECKSYYSKLDKVCPNCGCPQTTYQERSYYQEQALPQEQYYSANVEPTKEDLDNMAREDINRFNWGAFFLWPLWGFANGMSYLFLISIFVQLISWIILYYGSVTAIISYSFGCLLLNISFGINGSKWAWNNKEWRDLEHFREVQRSWKNWSIGLLLFSIFTGLVLFFMIIIISQSR